MAKALGNITIRCDWCRELFEIPFFRANQRGYPEKKLCCSDRCSRKRMVWRMDRERYGSKRRAS